MRTASSGSSPSSPPTRHAKLMSEEIAAEQPAGLVRYSNVDDELVLCRDHSRRWLRLWQASTAVLAVALVAVVWATVDVPILSSSHSSSSTTVSWLPLPSSIAVMTKIAFGSCSRSDMPQPYWDTISAYQPDLLLLMGDNVYGDCQEPTCQHLYTAYAEMAKHPSVQGFSKQVPVFATLDDHDYGLGDCSGSNPYKDIAKSAFADFFGLSNLPSDGVYRSSAFGPVGQRLQVILLDTRYNRSAFVSTGNTSAPYTPASDTDDQQMLSEQQWQWLDEQLQEPADLRVIVSSIQVLTDVCVFEAWRHLPAERERLYALLQDRSDTILLSGDRHVGGFYTGNDTSSTLREITASSFTHTLPYGDHGRNCSTAADCDEQDPRRLGDFVRVNHFGTLDIDWSARTFVGALRRAETTFGTMSSSAHQSDAGEIVMAWNYTF